MKAILESGKRTCEQNLSSGAWPVVGTEGKQGTGKQGGMDLSQIGGGEVGGREWQFRSWIMLWLDLFLRRIFLEAML